MVFFCCFGDYIPRDIYLFLYTWHKILKMVKIYIVGVAFFLIRGRFLPFFDFHTPCNKKILLRWYKITKKQKIYPVSEKKICDGVRVYIICLQ